ncbi:MAG: hypothetical protein OXC79_09575 [Candidatus Poribacteria bacterium]|nr:hypothetical protein [Candidatus Poribacteria bacterium]
MLQIYLKSNVASNTFKNAVKPNFKPSGSREPQRRWVSLGFLFDVASMGQPESCVPFQGFGSIRSTQPTGLGDRGGYFFFKLTPMVHRKTAPTGPGGVQNRTKKWIIEWL